ncbi:hypothetical protein [Methylorubrum populi]|uniref:hypothetical protein n=1 Tax=Methylorubrum populi TaxID=223967 RepID=UPI000DB8B052|nr:hypothetical protein [Methylorubrum populi]PZP71739.1 MAG: hypothetical protein DI590_05610 [Methylorubrum populi]
MIVETKQFFNLIRIHHKLSPAARPADLIGRLTAMADPANEQMRVSPLTRRCLRLFIDRRHQTSAAA